MQLFVHGVFVVRLLFQWDLQERNEDQHHIASAWSHNIDRYCSIGSRELKDSWQGQERPQ